MRKTRVEWAYEANATVASSYPAQVGALTGTDDDVSASFADGRITVSWDCASRITAGPLPATDFAGGMSAGPGNGLPSGQCSFACRLRLRTYIMIGPAPLPTSYEFQVLAVNSLTDDDDVDNSTVRQRGGTEAH